MGLSEPDPIKRPAPAGTPLALSPVMVAVRPQFDAGFPAHRAGDGTTPPACGAKPGGRLNLLLSYAGYQPDPWVERLPPLLEPMGIISLRAATGREASEVIRANPIHIAVVDLGLPLEEAEAAAQTPGNFAAPLTSGDLPPDAPDLQEAGPKLLEMLARLTCPPPTVVVKRARSHRDDHREMAAALRAGAFAVVDRPRDLHDLNVLLEVLRRCLARFYHGRWPPAPSS